MNTIFRTQLFAGSLKALFFCLIMVGISAQAGATITVTPASSSICTNYASTGQAPMWTTLGTITLREGANSDFGGGVNGSWTVSITLAAPAGWQFNSAVSPTLTRTGARNVSTVTVGSFTSSSLTINISGSNKNKSDKVLIAGLQVQPTSTSAATGNITPSAITGTATGITTSSNFGTLSIASTTPGAAGVTVSATPAGAICAGSNVSFSASVANGGTTPSYQWKLNGSNIAGATNATYSSSALANDNTVVCSVTSYSCIATPVATATTTMTVNALPSSISGAATVCTGVTTTYTNSTSGGSWSSSNTDVASVDASTGVITGLTAGVATISYATSSGCYATKALTVNAGPGAIGGTTSICAGATTTLTNGNSGTWTSSATGVATVNASGVVSGVAAGSATISLTLANACFSTAVISVNAIPANIAGTQTVCAGSVTTLTNTTGGGTWISGNTAAATVGASSGIVSGVASGTSIITYALASGCSKTAIVTVNTTPLISGASNVCTSSTTTLSSTAGGTWTSSSSSVASVGASTGVVSGVAQGTVTISYSLSTGCRATTAMTVGTTPAAITGASLVCSGSTITLSNTSLYGTWSSGNTAVASISAAGIVTGGVNGTATISYTSCGSTATKTVTVSNSPITGSLAVCTGYTTSLGNASTGGAWASGNTLIATVGSAAGIVTGVANGTATVSYTYGGCISTAVVTVNVAPAPISGTAVICQGSTTTLSSSTQYGSWSSSDAGIASVGSGTGVVTGLAEGTSVITYSTGCGTSSNTTLTVNVLPAAISGTTPVCEGATLTLTSSGGGTWTSGNTSVATINGATGLVTGVTAGTANITYMLATGCNVNGVVTVNARPSAIAGTATVCQGNNTTLSNTGGGTWSSANTAVATVGTTGIVAGVAAGTAIVSYTLSTGCASSATVTVNALPSAISGAAAICQGSTTSLTSSAGGTWSSSISGVASINASTGVVTGLSAGTSNISYVLSTGCKTGKQVTVNALPSAISGTATVCVGATTTLTNTGGGTWGSDNSSVATIGASTGVVTGIAAGTANITYTLSTGCTSSKVVTVNTIPSAGTISGVNSECVADANTLTSTVSGGVWTVSDSSIVDIDGDTGEAFGIMPGSVTVYYAVTSACGTSYTTSAFTVVDVPTVNAISGTSAICAGTNLSLSEVTTGGAWSSSNISTATVGTNGLVAGVSAGTATISYAVTNACGTAAASAVVTVNAQPGAIAGTLSACVGATSTLSNGVTGGTWSSSNANVSISSGVVTAVSAGTSMVTYTLSSGCYTTAVFTVNAQPSAITGTLSACVGVTRMLYNGVAGGTWSSSNANISVSPGSVTALSAGTSVVTYSLPSGCYVTSVFTVNAQPAGISGTLNACEGATSTLSNSVAGGTWSSSNSNISISSGVVTAVSAGASAVTYTLPSGCYTTAGFTVKAQPAVIAGASALCAGSSSSLSNTVAGGTWSSSNASVASVNTSGVGHGISGGSATVTYTLSSGCFAVRAVTVNANPIISGTSSVCAGYTATLNANIAGGTWASANTAVATIASNGTYTGVTAGTATVTYTLPTGCSSTYIVSVNGSVAAISGASSLCAGATATLSTSSTTGVWSSANPAVATVDAATGIVTAMAAGTTTISYSISSFCPSIQVLTVNALPAAITGTSTVCAGTAATLSSATAGGVWATADTTATITAAGVATGAFEGVTTISYTLPTGCYTTSQFTVNAMPHAIAGVSNVCAGNFVFLTNEVAGGIWSVQDSTIARFTEVGTLTGFAAGTTTVTYTLSSGCMVTMPITVNPAVPANTGIAHVCTGATTILSNPVAGGVWSSNIPAYAPIDAAGVVSGVSAGNITMTYTLSTGCFQTTVVTVDAVPVPFGGVATVCAGNTTQFSNATPGGAWSSSNNSIATVTALDALWGKITAVSAGTATITYTLPTGCLRTRDVTVNPLATIGGVSALCVGSSATLSTDIPGGTWTDGLSPVASVGMTDGLVTGLMAGGIMVTYYLPTGCKSTWSVGINQSLDIAGNANLCVGATTTLTNMSFGGIWSSSDNSVASVGASTGAVSAVSTGTATISYTNTLGCIRTMNVTVSPSVAAIDGASTVCAGSPVIMSSTSAGGVWSSSNPSVASIDAASGMVTGIASGYTATISYTLAGGCRATKVITVGVAPAAIAGVSSVCQGSTFTLSNTVTGGAWSSSNTAVATVGSAVGNVIGLSNGTTTISYTLSSGCAQTKVVSVNSIAPITGGNSVCAGSTVTLANSVDGGTWVSSAAGVATINASGTLTGVAAGTTTVSYILGAGSACYATSVVTVSPLPAYIGGVPSMCLGSATSLSNATASGTWSSSDNTIATISPLNATWGSAVSVSAGTATISYTSTAGCVRTAVITVNPVAPIAAPSNVCVGSSVTLSNSVGGGAWTSSSLAFATVGATTGVATGMVQGGVYITYTLPTGCKSIAPLVVSAVYAITGSATACTGATTTLANSITGGTWTSSDTTIASVGSTGVLSGVGAGTTVISYTNPAGCAKSLVVTVNPGVGTISGPSYVCYGASAPLGVTVTGGAWSSSSPAIVAVGSGSGVVTGMSPGFGAAITYTLPQGCRAIKAVSVSPVPGAISGVFNICQGLPITLASATAGGTWTTSDSSILTNTGAVITGVNAGTATVSYTLSSGCMQTKVITVNALAPIVGAGSVCAGSAIALSNINAGGTWTSAAVAIATVGTTGVVTGVAAGTSNISYTLPSGCRATVIVTVGATPTISGSLVMCPGTTVPLTASIAGGTWVSSNLAVATNVAGAVTGVAAGNADISYTMPSGCAAVKTITVNPMPTAISGGSAVCAGSALTLSNAVPGGTWTSSNAAVATVGTSGIVTGVAGGAATITYSTGTGCTVTQAITIGPILPITGTTSACLGMTTTLGDASTGGTWTSSNAAVAAINPTTGVINGASIGTATVTYTLASGCARTAIVSVNAVPTAITGVGTVCAGVTTTLAGDAAGGTWTSSNGAVATVSSTNGIVTGVASGVAVVTYTSGLSCRVITVVTVNSIPAITGTTRACVGTTTTLANTTVGGAWSSADLTVANIGADNGVVTGVAAGTAVITYAPVSGCPKTTVVTVYPLPTPIYGTLSACVGATATVADATAGGVSWTMSNTAIATVPASCGVVTGVAAGTTILTYTVNTGCIATAVFTVNPLPEVISGPSTLCMGGAITLADATAGGSWVNGNIGRANVGSTTGVVVGVTAGTFNVTYTLPTGCRSSIALTVNPAVANTGVATLNAGAVTTLSNAVTGGTWSSANTSIAGVDASGSVSGVSGGTVNILYTTAAGCVSNTVVTVNLGSSARSASEMPAEAVTIALYPNPTSGVFTINTSNAGTLMLFGIDGKDAGSYTIAAGATQVQLAQSLPAGVYMCRFTDTAKNTTIVRLVYQP